jgi:hypothetical protein
MKEIWKEFGDGSYEISDHGKVRRAKPGSNTYVGKMIKLGRTHKGYVAVQLYVDGKNKCYFVHKLVAAAFIGPRPKGLQINHKDLKKVNNYYKNLEYKTGIKNIKHALKHGAKFGAAGRDTHGENNPSAKLNWDMVRKIRKLDVTNKYTQQELAEKFNLTQATIWPILVHKTWKELHAA